jgi:hypothetical protein
VWFIYLCFVHYWSLLVYWTVCLELTCWHLYKIVRSNEKMLLINAFFFAHSACLLITMNGWHYGNALLQLIKFYFVGLFWLTMCFFQTRSLRLNYHFVTFSNTFQFSFSVKDSDWSSMHLEKIHYLMEGCCYRFSLISIWVEASAHWLRHFKIAQLIFLFQQNWSLLSR